MITAHLATIAQTPESNLYFFNTATAARRFMDRADGLFAVLVEGGVIVTSRRAAAKLIKAGYQPAA